MNSDTEPRGWRTETPRYRATRDLKPSNPRHRLEPPFSTMWDSDTYQYLEPGQSIAAGDIVATKSWPHPSFRPAGPIADPAHYAAERVLSFFSGAMKSRLGLSPFRGDRIVLDDGLSGPTQPSVTIKSGAAA